MVRSGTGFLYFTMLKRVDAAEEKWDILQGSAAFPETSPNTNRCQQSPSPPYSDDSYHVIT
jgi:hypothetical protein